MSIPGELVIATKAQNDHAKHGKSRLQKGRKLSARVRTDRGKMTAMSKGGNPKMSAQNHAKLIT